jgi:hypothetical protein
MRVYRRGQKRHVVVIGAGPGGLAAAMLLAQRGFRVQVFEKQDVIGGRSAEVRLGEYRFDLGPTFLMMKFLLDELFAEGGRRSSDYLQFRALDPMYALNFPDKTMLARSRPDAMKAEIEKDIFPVNVPVSTASSSATASASKRSIPVFRSPADRWPVSSVPPWSPPCPTSLPDARCTVCSPATSVLKSSGSLSPFNPSISACPHGIAPDSSP